MSQKLSGSNLEASFKALAHNHEQKVELKRTKVYSKEIFELRAQKFENFKFLVTFLFECKRLSRDGELFIDIIHLHNHCI